jgi:acyl-CoA thioesterase-1
MRRLFQGDSHSGVSVNFPPRTGAIGSVLIGFLLLLMWLPAPSRADPSPRPVTVIVFGDSITEGGALPKDQRDRAWVRIIERESKGALKVINEGKGGRPTQSVPEFEAMLTRQPRADWLVLALGTNDSRDITKDCVPKAVANLRKMIERARVTYGRGTGILLVGPPNINKSALVATKPIANEREARLRELGEAFSALAKETGCGFVSLFGAVPEGSMTKDGVHPDPAGNAAIARVILPKLTAKQR